jgi:histidine triad (HIT) family protein
MTGQAGCVFCEIVAGRVPAYKIYEDELSICFLDINPYAKGHCLVIPKRHVPWWHELTEEENASLFKVAKIVANKIKDKFKADFVFLWARGTRIPHTHIFLVPTFNGDGLDMFFNALENFQEAPRLLMKLTTPEEMADAARLLKS